MSENLKRYHALSRAIDVLEAAGACEYAEDILIGYMDDLWCKMSKEELESLRNKK